MRVDGPENFSLKDEGRWPWELSPPRWGLMPWELLL